MMCLIVLRMNTNTQCSVKVNKMRLLKEKLHEDSSQLSCSPAFQRNRPVNIFPSASTVASVRSKICLVKSKCLKIQSRFESTKQDLHLWDLTFNKFGNSLWFLFRQFLVAVDGGDLGGAWDWMFPQQNQVSHHYKLHQILFGTLRFWTMLVKKWMQEDIFLKIGKKHIVECRRWRKIVCGEPPQRHKTHSQWQMWLLLQMGVGEEISTGTSKRQPAILLNPQLISMISGEKLHHPKMVYCNFHTAHILYPHPISTLMNHVNRLMMCQEKNCNITKPDIFNYIGLKSSSVHK